LDAIGSKIAQNAETARLEIIKLEGKFEKCVNETTTIQ
jgi:hypothetical protein